MTPFRKDMEVCLILYLKTKCYFKWLDRNAFPCPVPLLPGVCIVCICLCKGEKRVGLMLRPPGQAARCADGTAEAAAAAALCLANAHGRAHPEDGNLPPGRGSAVPPKAAGRP